MVSVYTILKCYDSGIQEERPDLVPLYQAFPEIPVISISQAQRRPLPRINWQGTVYHGLPEDLDTFHAAPGDYLAFLWRISPEKRVERDKDAFLGQAYDLLFPIDWPEPFGLVLSEALACGTPVIAFGHGSVPELIEEGGTGFIVSSMEEVVQAVSRVPTVSRGR
jgi:glycosyltransferase involved in cell wall biosynthesis